ncbi:MAG TPA: carboxylesterase, partial [Casimicrobiaceae bacterium]|nr:carboxylesterase [Casimicrobiaceae bacterium]
NRNIPIFMAHGTQDPVVQLPWAQASHRMLEEAGYKVEWHTYPMAHSVVWEEIAAVSAFLSDALGRASSEG